MLMGLMKTNKIRASITALDFTTDTLSLNKVHSLVPTGGFGPDGKLKEIQFTQKHIHF